MPKLTLIRHAPTSQNRNEVFMGVLDAPASEEGLAAARGVGEQLSGSLTRCYSSPLRRASETAERLFLRLPVTTDPDLAERNLGDWAGHAKKEILAAHPEAFYPNGNIRPEAVPPGGETLEHMIRRVDRFLSRMAELEPEEHAAAVTHNGVIRIARWRLEGLTLDEALQANEPFLKPRSFDLPSTA